MLESIRDRDVRPASWADVLEMIRVLSTAVPPESILRVAEQGAEAGPVKPEV